MNIFPWSCLENTAPTYLNAFTFCSPASVFLLFFFLGEFMAAEPKELALSSRLSESSSSSSSSASSSSDSSSSDSSDSDSG